MERSDLGGGTTTTHFQIDEAESWFGGYRGISTDTEGEAQIL